MDGERFDTIVRALATASRRSALRLLAGGALGAALAAPGPERAAAKKCEQDKDCHGRQRCCDRRCTDTDGDDKHCGKCGKECKGGKGCCNGRCKDLDSDSNACGRPCRRCRGPEPHCVRGRCRACPKERPVVCRGNFPDRCCPAGTRCTPDGCKEDEGCPGGAGAAGAELCCPPEAPIECPAGFKARCCRVGQVCCEKRRICCPQEVPHCCPPAEQGFQTPCCPPERPNCCAGAGGCCANGFACKPEGCVLIQ